MFSNLIRGCYCRSESWYPVLLQWGGFPYTSMRMQRLQSFNFVSAVIQIVTCLVLPVPQVYYLKILAY